MCHLSHSYHAGACLYFTFALQAVGRRARPLEQYDVVKSAIQQAFVDSGATLSHHHAVGTEHARWLEEDISAPGVAMLRALFDGIDPGANLNPGKIVGQSAVVTGPRALAVALVGVDRLVLLQRQRDVVEAVEQAVLDLGVDLEACAVPARPAHLLRGEVDLRLAGVGDRRDVLGGQLDRQQADLRAVGAEDVGEARRDDRPEAVVLQRPRRVLAARAAAEVAPGDEDRVARQVPVGLLGPVVEQELAEARALDALEELLGDDLVGVDVVAVEDADRRR